VPDAEEYLKSFVRQNLLHLHTAMPARIVGYDETRRRATIQPLHMTKEAGRPPRELPVVQNVPVISWRLRVDGGESREYVPDYRPGDIVFVAFSERALDTVLAGGGRPVLPDSTRHHSLNDAVILGRLIP
jgi:hypothetical protein